LRKIIPARTKDGRRALVEVVGNSLSVRIEGVDEVKEYRNFEIRIRRSVDYGLLGLGAGLTSLIPLSVLVAPELDGFAKYFVSVSVLAALIGLVLAVKAWKEKKYVVEVVTPDGELFSS
jgi:hypothetical protein